MIFSFQITHAFLISVEQFANKLTFIKFLPQTIKKIDEIAQACKISLVWRLFMSTSIICEPEAVWRQVATHKPLRDIKICSSGQNFENKKLERFQFKIL